MIQLLKYAKKYKKQIILGPFFKLLEAIFELVLPLYMATLIDQGIHQNDLHFVWITAGKMLIMTLVGLVCVLICQYYASIASQGFGTELRTVLFKKINQFSHTDLDQFSSDTLVTRMTNDVNQLQLALAMLIRLVIRAPFLSVGAIIMAFYIQPSIAILFSVVLPIFFFILVILIKKTVPYLRKVQGSLDKLTRNLQENLVGIRVIRAFAGQKKQTTKMVATNEALASSSLHAANISALLNPLTILIMNTAVIFLLYFGGHSVDTGSLTQGQVVALVNYLMQMLLALIVVSNLVTIFTRAATSAKRVNEILAVPTHDEIPSEKLPPLTSTNKQNQLVFDHVFFQYPQQHGWALEDISFSIKQGDFLGITGATGSGKTTLIQLLLRFYEISEGTLSIFGTAIDQFSINELRQEIRLVPQKSVLISGTILSNLQWGKADVTEDEAWQALKIAQAADFVKELPKQLAHEVSENGDNFSGGQKQRLAIARAIINQPTILVMDDSTSALDYQTDARLRQSLQTYLPDTTLVIISQRISSIRQANTILVIDEGKISARGTHEELLNTSTIYHQIADSQEEVDKMEGSL